MKNFGKLILAGLVVGCVVSRGFSYEQVLKSQLVASDNSVKPSQPFKKVTNTKSIKPSNAPKTAENELTNLSEVLDWVVTDRGCGQLCGGFYREPLLNPNNQPILPEDESVTFVNQVTEIRLTPDGTSMLIGEPVEIKQNGRLFNAKKVYLHREAKRIKSAELIGDVRLREQGRLLAGRRAHLDFTNGTARVDHARYRLAPNQRHTTQDAILPTGEKVDGSFHIFSLNAWGKALRLNKLKDGLYKLYQASYTTCPPTRKHWHLEASRLFLDRDSGWGHAHHARLYIKDTPVFYWPYFTFPIDSRRKSGFLYPNYGYSNRHGATISVPYYWNIAPNYDMTMTPVSMSHRGFQLNNEFRYLTRHSRGALHLSGLIDDRAFRHFRDRAVLSNFSQTGLQTFSRLKDASDDRWFVHWADQSQWSPHWSSSLDYMAVSDDYYFEDFDRFRSSDSKNPEQLVQKINLKYSDVHWQVTLGLLNYQTLHPANQAPLSGPYNQLPVFNFSGVYPNQSDGLIYSLSGQYVNFTHHRTPDSEAEVVVGQRVHLEPGIQFPIRRPYGYLIPEIKLMLTQYQLEHQAEGHQNNPSRVLPIFDVHSGLYFERETQWFGDGYRQTLEPEWYYLFVPKQGQDDLPLFDTLTTQITIPQMLRDNRFSGIDRIGDANQMAFVLTSRYLEAETGIERLKAQIGKILYFRDRDITFCQITGCEEMDGLNHTDHFSPTVISLTYRLDPTWLMRADFVLPNDRPTPISQGISLNYHRDERHLFNLGYSDTQQQSNFQIGGIDINRNDQVLGTAPKLAWASTIWPVPLTNQWYFLGYANYDVSHHHGLGTFYGLEYNDCCWALRIISSRKFKYQEDQHHVYDDSVLFQIVLKGLGQLGRGDEKGLLRQINHYQDPNPMQFRSYRNLKR